MKILAIEDDEIAGAWLTQLLHSGGHELQLVGDAESGLRLLETAAPDLALVDLMLPGLPGLEFIRRARQLRPGLICVVKLCRHPGRRRDRQGAQARAQEGAPARDRRPRHQHQQLPIKGQLVAPARSIATGSAPTMRNSAR